MLVVETEVEAEADLTGLKVRREGEKRESEISQTESEKMRTVNGG